MRHAAAIPASHEIRDNDRYLTATGRQNARGVGRVLREQGVEFDAVVSSPLPRAVQTAELIADAVDFLGVVETHFGLGPEAQPRMIAEEIPTKGLSVAVVGHAPAISMLGAIFVGQPGFQPFRTGQVFALEDGRPLWMIRPDALQVQDFVIPS